MAQSASFQRIGTRGVEGRVIGFAIGNKMYWFSIWNGKLFYRRYNYQEVISRF